jgi:hypothetical protein
MGELSNYLSKELRRFYTRRGSRIVFSNKLTLNQFALSMWENAGCHGMDASALSRVLKGERLFTTDELYGFAALLHLGEKNINRLKIALSYDLNNRFGLDIDYIEKSDESILSISEGILRKARELKNKDLVIDADGLLDQASTELRRRIYTTLNERTRILLERVYAEYLIEKIYTLQVTKSREESFKPIIFLSNKIIHISEALKDPVYLYIAKAHLGDIHYINRSYRCSVKYLEEAMTYYDKRVLRLYPWTPLRPLALSYAHLGNESEFDGVRDKILAILPTLRIDAQCLALEGIAKGEAILGKTAWSENYFVKDYYAHSKLKSIGGSFEKLMRILIICGELESAQCLPVQERQSTNYIEKIGKEGFRLAKKYGYKRHEKKINFLLNGLLN